MISTANLPQTCGQCHVGDGANFAKEQSILNSGLTSEALPKMSALSETRIVRWIYVPLMSW